jgi:hypothetical protein
MEMAATPVRGGGELGGSGEHEEGRTFRHITMGYGSFATPVAARLAPPPPFTPETFSLLESKREELLREEAESRHYEVNELLEREAREHSLLFRAFRGFFESRRYKKERKWFLSLPWNTIRIITLSSLFFFALYIFVQQPVRPPPAFIYYFIIF